LFSLLSFIPPCIENFDVCFFREVRRQFYLIMFLPPFFLFGTMELLKPPSFLGLFKNVQLQGTQKPNREAYMDIR